MFKKIKAISSIMLTICLVMGLFSTVTTVAEEITPYYNNTASASCSIGIDENGELTISYRLSGYPSTTTKAVITTYIEKRFLGVFWTRVDIGTTDNQWVDTINDYRYTGNRTYQLSDTGTYRVTVTYVVYGSGGDADEITCQEKATY